MFCVVVALFIATLAWLVTVPGVQAWLLDKGRTALAERLGTRVQIARVALDWRHLGLTAYDIAIADRRDTTMLAVDTLSAAISMPRLLTREVALTHIDARGLTLHLYRAHPDTAANYQFAIDAFKKPAGRQNHKTTKQQNGKGPRFTLDACDDITLTRLAATWAVLSSPNRFALSGDATLRSKHKLRADLNITTTSTLPPRWQGRPHRGAFDTRHTNIDITLRAKVRRDGRTLQANITQATACDHASGLDIRQLTAHASLNPSSRLLTCTDLDIRLASTRLSVDTIQWQGGRLLRPAHVTSDRVVLQDIAQPFAPALSNFTTPLTLRCTTTGTADNLRLSAIRIATPDRRLRITARGQITGITQGRKLRLVFGDIDLTAKQRVKEEIIAQFRSKLNLKMMRQVRRAGDIFFRRGALVIAFRRQRISGTLETMYGNIYTDFTLNNRTRYMTGTARSESLDITPLFRVKRLQPFAFRARYNIDIASRRVARRLGRKRGKLPHGNATLEIDSLRYGILSLHRLLVDISSNGTTATGTATAPRSWYDICLDFRYTQTADTAFSKVKPRFVRHKQSKKTIICNKR